MVKTEFLVSWFSIKSMKNYTIGFLTYNNQSPKWQFKYNYKELKLALRDGFTLISGFLDPTETYSSDTLFSIFKCRIPGAERFDLLKGRMYNEVELLKESKPLITDNLNILYYKKREQNYEK